MMRSSGRRIGEIAIGGFHEPINKPRLNVAKS